MAPRAFPRRPARLVVAAFAALSVFAFLGTALLYEGGPLVPLFFSLFAYVAVGGTLAVRRPENQIGWLLLLFGSAMELSGAAAAYAWQALIQRPGALPSAEIALLLSNSWIPGLVSLFFAVLIFPTGRLPSHRWRWPAAGLLVAGILILASAVFGQQNLDVPTQAPATGSTVMSVPNPLVVQGPVGALLAFTYTSPLLVVIALIPGAAVLWRLRAAEGIERQQLKLFAYAAALTIALLFVSATHIAQFGVLTPLVTILSLDLLPLAVAVAIVRYRLYDIDVVIERTVVYGTVTALLFITYTASVIGMQGILHRFTAGDEVAVAASTLLVIVLFQPFRARIRDAVDRRFYRAHYDAQRTLDAFGAQLRDEVNLDALKHHLLTVADETMRPVRVSLWLREPVPAPRRVG